MFKWSAGVIMGLLAVLITAYFAIAFWTQDEINFWASHILHKAVDVPFWLCCFITFVTGGADLLFDLIATVARAFVA